VRTFLSGHAKMDDGKGRTFEPFVEANWLHNTREFGTAMNAVDSAQRGTRNVAELKVGVDGELTRNVSLWGHIGQQVGDKGYSDTGASVGMKVSF
jgi:autotransporter family porin